MRTHTKKSTDVIRNIPQDTYLYVKFTKMFTLGTNDLSSSKLIFSSPMFLHLCSHFE